MNRPIKHIWIGCCILLLFFSPQKVEAQQEEFQSSQSTLAESVKSMDSTRLNAFRKMDAFNYELKEPKLSWLEKMLNWIAERLEGNRKQSKKFWTVVGYLIAAFAMILIIFTLLKVKFTSLFAKTSKSHVGWEGMTEEEFKGTDFQKQIQSALSEENYTYAIRLQYLESLKKLTEAAIITWMPNKTNFAYQKELSGTGLEQEFENIARVYEYAWYGEFPVDKIKYHKIQDLFVQFRTLITSFSSS